MKKICIIIPVYNALNETKACIKSLIKKLDFDKCQVILANDCSDKKTETYLKNICQKYNDKFTLYRNNNNLGYLKTCNNAIQAANAEIIVLLNSDTEINDNFEENIRKCFDSDSNIIAASPISSASATYYIPQILPLKFMNSLLNKRSPKYPEIFNSEGFCFCIRKSYIDKYGLFDEIYNKGYCEEVDFCLRARKNGYKSVLIDNLYVKHKRHKSFKNTKNKYLAENNEILYSRWADYFHQKDIKNMNVHMKELIKEVFGNTSYIPLAAIKINNQRYSNRIHTLKNIFKTQKSKTYKGVIYTCIAGNSDIIPIIQTHQMKDWKYVCFTDNRTLLRLKKLGMWEIKPLVFNTLDDTRNARWHKTHPHIIFPNYEQSIWIDANIDVLTPFLEETITKADKSLLVPLHYCRNCIYKEFEAIQTLKTDNEEIVNKTYNLIKQDGMPENYGLNETNIIYRKHNLDDIRSLMNNWWDIIHNYSKRDQLSFSYILWKNNISLKEISIKNARIDVYNFKTYTHNPSNTFTGKILGLIFHK